VGNAAIGQSSVWNRYFEIGAEYGRLERPAELAYVTRDGSANRLDNAAQRGAQAVQRRALGLLHGVARNIFVAGVHYKPGNFLSGAHCSPL
jgi:hypothetical protein